MVQKRISIHRNHPYHRNSSASRLAVVTIPIKLNWIDEGKVVTETSTEYKELTDDSEHSGFGSELDNKLKPISQQLERYSVPIHSPGGNSSQQPFLQPKKLFPESSSSISTKSSSSSDDDADGLFEEDALRKHNEYRAKHGCPPLKLDEKLCQYAQEWANKQARENRFEHRQNVPFGENLYCTWSSNPKRGCSGSKAVESWYSEIEQHQFGTEPRSMGTGHFTQVIWKASKNLGVAKARSSSGKIIVVANYEPAGNFIGQYVQNVPPPK